MKTRWAGGAGVGRPRAGPGEVRRRSRAAVLFSVFDGPESEEKPEPLKPEERN
jgi:hypothetical protein